MRAAATAKSKTARSERAAKPRAAAARRTVVVRGNGRGTTYMAAKASKQRGATTQTADKPGRKASLRVLIAEHADRYEVPATLVRRVIQRESSFNPKARNGSFIGLMQIRVETARGLGYTGTVSELTDPDTNLKYGVAYLANAYRIADGDEDDAIRLYRTGYHREAKRKGMLGQLIAAR